ncbi:MAG TPA: hypothetical protein VFF63_05570 [Candidatus Babeliales bacterium]|nr:hypothetical protein [Candidatus Babeliales bacterium]
MDFLELLSTPGTRAWLEDYAGGIHDCSLLGHCKLAESGYPYALLNGPHPSWMAYSPNDHQVYVSNPNTGCIYKFSLSDKARGKLCRDEFRSTSDAMVYYHDKIWLAIGPDNQGRPLFASLSSTGKIAEFALPILGPTYGPTAMVDGPDGHLWYLRGRFIGEILSEI